MNINAVNLSGNSYLNYVYVAAIEIPGFWTAILLLDRIGRKPLLIFAYFLCCACQFAFAFMPAGMATLSMAVYLIGKYSIAIVMTSVYVYTAELFPTKYRHTLFAFSSMVGRLGSITAPLTPSLATEVWEPFPPVLFGAMALLSGLLIFLTPETLGTKLPDTMEDAEELSAKKN
ncbi:major facilitator superfamily domain-containing protein [Phthorimaea operculella]|nr:major facilitator superfamily domain-containing protein [Phthorimaea operculella]